uniref:Uncharacterized protein n=1 Tax=Triticum urartu TaxID=4572 RepID=A0A8R7U9Y7_TRIUA
NPCPQSIFLDPGRTLASLSVSVGGLLLRQQPRDEWHAVLGDPELPLDEPLHGVLLFRLPVGHVLDALPRDAVAHVGPRPPVVHLGVVAGAEREVAEPRQPPLRVDELADLGLDVEGAGVLLPRPPQERPEPADVVLELRVRLDGAVVDDDAAGRVPLLAPLRRDDVLLVLHAPAHLEDAVLEHHLRVAEDEVDGAAHGAVAVVLPAGVRVERVLVPVELALVEHRLVALHPQRHGLVVLGARRVLHRDPAHEEAVADRLHGGRVLGGDVHHEVLVPRDDRLADPVADHDEVRHVARHGDVLLVRALLDVHHVRVLALERHLGQRLVDGLVVAAAVRRHRHVRLEVGLAGRGLQQPPLGVRHPPGRAVVPEQPPAEDGQVQVGDGVPELVHDGQDVLRQLLGDVKRLAHLGGGVRRGVGEAVKAGLLVRERGGEPRLEVVHGVLEVGHLEAAELVEGGLEVVDGVVEHLLAVLERARRARVVFELVEQAGLLHGLLDPLRGGLEDGLGQLRGGRRIAGRLLQRLLARHLVVHGLAEGLDRLHRRRQLRAVLLIFSFFEGHDADGGDDRHRQDGRRADYGAFAHGRFTTINTSRSIHTITIKWEVFRRFEPLNQWKGSSLFLTSWTK